MPSSSRFAYAFLPFFPTPPKLLSSRRSGAQPCTAQRSGGGATSSLDLLKRGAFSKCIVPVFGEQTAQACANACLRQLASPRRCRLQDHYAVNRVVLGVYSPLAAPRQRISDP